jgi:hypothetical protein
MSEELSAFQAMSGHETVASEDDLLATKESHHAGIAQQFQLPEEPDSGEVELAEAKVVDTETCIISESLPEVVVEEMTAEVSVDHGGVPREAIAKQPELVADVAAKEIFKHNLHEEFLAQCDLGATPTTATVMALQRCAKMVRRESSVACTERIDDPGASSHGWKFKTHKESLSEEEAVAAC